MIIDLDGPLGNAFYLISIVRKLCRISGGDADSIINDMKSGDYHHLLKVFIKNFPGVGLTSRDRQLLKVLNDEK